MPLPTTAAARFAGAWKAAQAAGAANDLRKRECGGREDLGEKHETEEEERELCRCRRRRGRGETLGRRLRDSGGGRPRRRAVLRGGETNAAVGGDDVAGEGVCAAQRNALVGAAAAERKRTASWFAYGGIALLFSLPMGQESILEMVVCWPSMGNPTGRKRRRRGSLSSVFGIQP